MSGFVCEIDWQAIATFSAGCLAVGAAIYVGKKQTNILERQGRVQELELRHALYDRRYAIYDVTRILVEKIQSFPQDKLHEDFTRFSRAILEGNFLFCAKTCSDLSEIRQKSIHLWSIKVRMKIQHDNEGKYDKNDVTEKHELLGWFSKRWDTLPLMFEELNLAVLSGSITPLLP